MKLIAALVAALPVLAFASPIAQDIAAPPDFGPARLARFAQDAASPPDFGPGKARRQDENDSTEFGGPAGLISPFDPARRSAQEIGISPDFGPGRVRRQEIGQLPKIFGGTIHVGAEPKPAPGSIVDKHEVFDGDEPKGFGGLSFDPLPNKPEAFPDVKPWGHGVPKANHFTKTYSHWSGPFGTGRPSHFGFVKPTHAFGFGVGIPLVTRPVGIKPSEFTGPALEKHVETEIATTRTWWGTVPHSPAPNSVNGPAATPWGPTTLETKTSSQLVATPIIKPTTEDFVLGDGPTHSLPEIAKMTPPPHHLNATNAFGHARPTGTGFYAHHLPSS